MLTIIINTKSIEESDINLSLLHNIIQVVVSDHGMTETGNHGGSSYEEVDSLALFVGLKNCVYDHASSNYDTVSQVMKLCFLLVGYIVINSKMTASYFLLILKLQLERF